MLGEGLTYFSWLCDHKLCQEGGGEACVNISRSELLGVCKAPNYPQLKNYCLSVKHTYNGNIHHMGKVQD